MSDWGPMPDFPELKGPFLLILGGTTEARQLAERVRGWTVRYALAGVTAEPVGLPPDIGVMQGGFGGEDGLTGHLVIGGYKAVLNATHPFAARMTRNAQSAARRARVPILHLRRPAWDAAAQDAWHRVPDLGAAAAALPAGTHAFLALGARHLDPFIARTDCSFTARVIDPPDPALQAAAPHIRFVKGRPPHSEESERQVLRESGASWLVTRNSGGRSGRTKLDAAAALGLNILIVDRPPMPRGSTTVADPAAALGWIDARRAQLA
ncbi:cobalt-precorrin-6A reductase [Oceanomicrobium pacificus]|uniref:Cobalt-precorrin-6A reductase n=1 Tax=Oceanomicrobium pacificus TaxID=2692916 RepID=A0A6B0TY53_9RHOB|nr:cobalt-precorrin-6A reductase [Oceanomicrobium pacificus]MXU65933.1 cobalt-precorrin-6A reductase [Oceanomicrobium pacificus]